MSATKIFLQTRARMGNAIFRYLAGALFCVLYGFQLTESDADLHKTIDDTYFLQWMHEYQRTGQLPALDTSKNYRFDGYFQHDKVYVKHKEDLLQYIRDHPEDRVRSDDGRSIHAMELLMDASSSSVPSYEVVLHLRLEDFILEGQTIHPDGIRSFLEKQCDFWSSPQLTIVMKQPTMEIEHKYIEYVTKDWKEGGRTVKMESNDLMRDFHIMKNARILICSCSTLSWTAALLSDSLETVYMPYHINHPGRIWETFRKPVEDTRASFPNTECSIYTLGKILGVHVPLPKTRLTTRFRQLTR
uniref:Uncharacterized protein n=1 Tax=viral metagenome TaxID=1070528 RepID=A0A6C0K0H5_9ZZZZ